MRRAAPCLLASCLVGWCLLAALDSPAAGPPPRPPNREQVARWIADLNAASPEARAAAARRLTALPHVPHALREAAGSSEAATRQRAAPVLAALERRLAPRLLDRAAAWAEQGEVDLVLEAVAVWGPKVGKDAGGRIVSALATEIVKRQAQLHKRLVIPNPGRLRLRGPGSHMALGDFDAYLKGADPKRVDGGNVALDKAITHFVRATGNVAFQPASLGLVSSLVVCSGDLAAPGQGGGLPPDRRLISTVVFAGGDLEAARVGDSVIICSGEVKLTGDTSGTLVIARGAFRDPHQSAMTGINVIISGATIDGQEFSGPPDRALAMARVERPLGFVRFFETARVGVEVAKPRRGKGVRITRLDATKPFGQAGLWKDDLISKVDGVEVNTPEQFRRALRRRFVEGGEAELRLQRDGEARTVFHVALRP